MKENCVGTQGYDGYYAFMAEVENHFNKTSYVVGKNTTLSVTNGLIGFDYRSFAWPETYESWVVPTYASRLKTSLLETVGELSQSAGRKKVREELENKKYDWLEAKIALGVKYIDRAAVCTAVVIGDAMYHVFGKIGVPGSLKRFFDAAEAMGISQDYIGGRISPLSIRADFSSDEPGATIVMETSQLGAVGWEIRLEDEEGFYLAPPSSLKKDKDYSDNAMFEWAGKVRLSLNEKKRLAAREELSNITFGKPGLEVFERAIGTKIANALKGAVADQRISLKKAGYDEMEITGLELLYILKELYEGSENEGRRVNLTFDNDRVVKRAIYEAEEKIGRGGI